MVVQEFVQKPRPQREWGGLIDAAFFLAGTGGGLFVLSRLVGFHLGLLLGLASGALACIALILDLGHPRRFTRVFLRPLLSWLSRGSLFLTAFLVFGVLYIAPSFPWLTWLPWSAEALLGQAVGVIATLAALGLAIYSGMAMSHSPSIPFWNTALLPMLVFIQAFVGGLAAMLVALLIAGTAELDVKPLVATEMLLVGASLVSLGVYLLVAAQSTVSARESVRLLTTGELAWLFLGAGVIVGLVVPLALLVYFYFALLPVVLIGSTMLAIAGILILLGMLVVRFSFLKAGVYVPAM